MNSPTTPSIVQFDFPIDIFGNEWILWSVLVVPKMQFYMITHMSKMLLLPLSISISQKMIKIILKGLELVCGLSWLSPYCWLVGSISWCLINFNASCVGIISKIINLLAVVLVVLLLVPGVVSILILI